MDQKSVSNDDSDDASTVSRKACSTQSRLRLKRSNVESEDSQSNVPDGLGGKTACSSDKDNFNQRIKGQRIPCSTLVESANDSILDFKSPEKKKTAQTNLAKSSKATTKRKKTKFNVLINDCKGSKGKGGPKNRRNSLENQCTIESSFFKSKTDTEDEVSTSDIRTALVCPLCFKTCKDVESQSLHMKICALKNKVSTKKLLDAIELQKRQADERKSLGLIAAPAVQDKKKQAPRRTNANEESDLQLAIALSKSLHEIEEINEINEIAVFPEISNTPTFGITDPTYKGQLEKFGFANSKAAASNKFKRRKHNELTVLQTRSDKERNRILTERIAQILMGNEQITRISREEEDNESGEKFKQNTVLNSQLLRELHCSEEERLWDKTRLTPSRKSFYVPDLSSHISPREEKIKPMSEESYETVLNIDQKEFYETPHPECRNSSFEKNHGYVNEPSNALIENWGNALNDSSASDVIVFVKDDKHIWTHKLVFYVRCSSILLDLTPNDNPLFSGIKEKIDWPDVSYEIALAFFEFVYCGIIKMHRGVFEERHGFSNLRNFARKYNLKDLFVYLYKQEAAIKRTKMRSNTDRENPIILERTDNSTDNSDGDTEIISRENEQSRDRARSISISSEADTVMNEPCSQKVTKDARSEENQATSNTDSLLHSTISPDMFDETDDTVLNYSDAYLQHVNNSVSQREKQLSVKEVDISTNNADVEENCEDEKKESPTVLSDSPATPSTETPRSSQLKGRRQSFDFSKQKSNLSLFIERVQKENARSDFDSDSDLDSVLPVRVKPNRNPFKIRLDESERYSASFCNPVVQQLEKSDSRTLEKTKSCFEFNVTTSSKSPVNLESSPLHLELSPDVPPNSTQFDDESEERAGNCSPKSENSEGQVHDAEITITSPPERTAHGNATLFEFDADETRDISMYSKYKRKHRTNSIDKYRDIVKKRMLDDSKPSRSVADNGTSADYQDLFADVDFDVESDFTETKETSATARSFSADLEAIMDDKYEDSVANLTTSFCREKKNQTTVLRHSQSEGNIELEGINGNKSLRDVGTNRSSTLGSPVLISSSPEINMDDLNWETFDKRESSVNSGISKKHEDTFQFFEKDIFLANVRVSEESSNRRSSISQTQYKSGKTIGEANNKITRRKSNEFEVPKRREIDVSEKRSVRKLNRKSVSEGNFSVNSVNRVNILNAARCKVSQPVIVKRNGTPPPNYNAMETPELHKRLKQYGLKLQKRSRAVKLLTYIYDELHPVAPPESDKIESVFTIISSEDEGPSTKGINRDDGDVERKADDYDYNMPLSQCSEASTQSPINMIAEELEQSDESESAAARNPANIKEMFFKLITLNKELHNKILTYEPLCIESLHSTFKAEGVKCKMNALMDFLDEQCITFYCLENSVKNRKERKRK